MGRQKTVQKKLQPYEIGELDQYLFGQGNALRDFPEDWERIRQYIKSRKVSILQYGRRMQRECPL